MGASDISNMYQNTGGIQPKSNVQSIIRHRDSETNTEWEIIGGRKRLIMQSGASAIYECDGEDEQHR
jgi:hypothetical protein